jgi:hypothetical protein
MRPNEQRLVWVVVEVISGVASEARAYATPASARRRLATLRNRLNSEYDDAGIFPVCVRGPKTATGRVSRSH